MILKTLIQKGGAVMWPLIVLAFVSVIIITDRIAVLFILRFSKTDKKPNPLCCIKLLELIAQIAPVLGFLGTVTGIMAAFKGMSLSSTVTLQTVSGGMYEALFTTAAGLIISLIDAVAAQICRWSAEKNGTQSDKI